MASKVGDYQRTDGSKHHIGKKLASKQLSMVHNNIWSTARRKSEPTDIPRTRWPRWPPYRLTVYGSVVGSEVIALTILQ